MARGYRDEDDDWDRRRPAPWSQDGARAIADSGKALKVRLRSGREVWIPKSVIHDDSEIYENGHEGKLVVESWFGAKESL